jgi:hypothetical protein
VKPTPEASGQNVRAREVRGNDVSARRLEIGRHGGNVPHSEIVLPDATGLPLATGHRVLKAEGFLIALLEATARHALKTTARHVQEAAQHLEIGHHDVTVQHSEIAHLERKDRLLAIVHRGPIVHHAHSVTVHLAVTNLHLEIVRHVRKAAVFLIALHEVIVHHALEVIVRHGVTAQHSAIVHLDVTAPHSEIGLLDVKAPHSMIVQQELIARHGEKAQEEALQSARRAVIVRRVRKDEAFPIGHRGVSGPASAIAHHAVSVRPAVTVQNVVRRGPVAVAAIREARDVLPNLSNA